MNKLRTGSKEERVKILQIFIFYKIMSLWNIS